MKVAELINSEELVKQFAQSVHLAARVIASNNGMDVPTVKPCVTAVYLLVNSVSAHVEYGDWHVGVKMSITSYEPDDISRLRASATYARSLADRLAELHGVAVTVGGALRIVRLGWEIQSTMPGDDGYISCVCVAQNKRASYYHRVKQFLLGLVRMQNAN